LLAWQAIAKSYFGRWRSLRCKDVALQFVDDPRKAKFLGNACVTTLAGAIVPKIQRDAACSAAEFLIVGELVDMLDRADTAQNRRWLWTSLRWEIGFGEGRTNHITLICNAACMQQARAD